MVQENNLSSKSPDDSDLIIFAEEPLQENNEKISHKTWKIVIVDDDEQVHVMSRLVCNDRYILGRKIELIDFYSSMEAMGKLPQMEDIAVFLLDVVMETEDAGLHLVKFIRNTLKWHEPRIVLRTGQPGRAPELDVIESYDINDYKTKHELTHDKLITTLIASLRNYEQLKLISAQRHGLEVIVKSTRSMSGDLGMNEFTNFVNSQVKTLIDAQLESIFCAKVINPQTDLPTTQIQIIGGSESFKKYLQLPIDHLPQKNILHLIKQSFEKEKNIFDGNLNVLFMKRGAHHLCLCIETEHLIDDTQKELLSVFAATVGISYENLALVHKLEYAAYFDRVSGLPNRNSFVRSLDEIAPNSDPNMNVCLMEINHYDDIFDGLGHDIGNELVRVIAKKLVDELPDCIISRTGTSVFGIYGPSHIINPNHLMQLLGEPFHVGLHTIPVGFNYGLCNGAIKSKDGTTLLKYTNIALHRANLDHTHHHEYFKPELEDHMQWRLNLIYQLRNDFRENRLAVWFQPKMHIVDKRTLGFEALIRWEEKPGHFIEPSVFIPLAEYSGLIVEIGYWVLEQACLALEWIEKEGKSSFTMAVNVSVPQFRSPHFIQRIEEIVSRYKISPNNLLFEVTESIVIDEPRLVIEALNALRTRGFKISIDDFGTGYSSLSYIQDLPLDELKIDRSFTAKITTEKGQALVSTITAMCKALSLSVIAEGVETADQSELLTQGGCFTAQGFLFSPPIPKSKLLDWLKENPGIGT